MPHITPNYQVKRLLLLLFSFQAKNAWFSRLLIIGKKFKEWYSETHENGMKFKFQSPSARFSVLPKALFVILQQGDIAASETVCVHVVSKA